MQFKRSAILRSSIFGAVSLAALAGAAMSGLAGGSAMAADLPSVMPPSPPMFMQPQQALAWTGFYAGLNVGAAIADQDGNIYSATPPGSVTPFGLPFSRSVVQYQRDGGSGVVGGGQIGYNYQTFGNFVVGVETDFSGSSYNARSEGTTTNYINFGPFGSLATSGTASVHDKMDWFGTARGRLGYAWGSMMPYVTGGFAYGHTEFDVTGPSPLTGLPGYLEQGGVKTGWVVGGGLEYALTRSIFLRAEYLHIDLGDHTAYSFDQFGNFTQASAAMRNNIFRVGVDYKFN